MSDISYSIQNVRNNRNEGNENGKHKDKLPLSPNYIAKKNKRTRQLQLKKKVLFVSLITVLLLLIMATIIHINSNSFSNKAQASVNGHYQYESILVEEGDTLTKIAKEHSDTYAGNINNFIEEVKQINHLENDFIMAGNYILVPVFVMD